MDYYIYELVDPRDGLPFYIGKGKRNRIDHHESEARKGVHSRKCDRIREIWESRLTVEKNILSRFKEEHEAYAAEKALIEEIGLCNLTNVVPGGVYVPRIKEKPPVWGLRALMKLAPSVARGLRHYAQTKSHAILFGKIDATAICFEILDNLVKGCGADTVHAELLKHRVDVQFIFADV